MIIMLINTRTSGFHHSLTFIPWLPVIYKSERVFFLIFILGLLNQTSHFTVSPSTISTANRTTNNRPTWHLHPHLLSLTRIDPSQSLYFRFPVYRCSPFQQCRTNHSGIPILCTSITAHNPGSELLSTELCGAGYTAEQVWAGSPHTWWRCLHLILFLGQ